MLRDATILQGLEQLTSWGILTTNADLMVTSWNPWLALHSGRPTEDVLGRPLFEVFPELTARRLDAFYRQALEGQVVVLSQRLHRYLLPMRPSLEGTKLAHMQQTARIVPLVEEGRIAGTLTVIEDVTERVVNDLELAARALQQSAVASLGQHALEGAEPAELMNEAATLAADTLGVELSAILEILPEGQALRLQAGVGWAAGQVGLLTLPAGTNSHAGYTFAVGGPVVMPNLDQETRFKPAAFLKTHGVVSGLSVPILGKARPFGVVSVFARQAWTCSDDQVHFLQTMANILGLALERRGLLEQLQARVAQLADADLRKDEFLAMLAHELRNPLAPLRNALHLLRILNPHPDADTQEAHGIMERQIEHLVRLVDDLLDVSRITRGKIQLQKERLDLATVAARAIEGSRPQIDARRHTLDVSFPKDAVLVDADPVRLAQVLWNLLNNAAKYTPEGGRIELRVERIVGARPGGDEAIVRVRDTGMGIPREMLSQIFDLFTQIDRTLDRSEGGLGIGLTLVRRLMEMHGGTVQAVSEGTGLGSEFSIRLPAVSAAAPAPASDPSLPSALANGRRILVVDDDRDSAESLAILLRLSGHDVRTTHDGRLALEVAAVYRPDVVLLDLVLPGMDALEVCRCLRQEAGLQDAVIVAMSGYGQDDDRQRSQTAGFDRHLVKPVDFRSLQAILALPELQEGKVDRASHGTGG